MERHNVGGNDTQSGRGNTVRSADSLKRTGGNDTQSVHGQLHGQSVHGGNDWN